MNLSPVTKVIIWAVSCVAIGLLLAAYDGVATPLGIAKTALGAAILILLALAGTWLWRKLRTEKKT